MRNQQTTNTIATEAHVHVFYVEIELWYADEHVKGLCLVSSLERNNPKHLPGRVMWFWRSLVLDRMEFLLDGYN